MSQEQPIVYNTAQPTATTDKVLETTNLVTENNSPTKQLKQSLQPLSESKRLYSDEELRKFQIRGVISLVGGILLHFVLSTFYLWGNISPYVAAYMRQYDKSVTLDFMSIVFPILAFITNSFLSFGIKIAERVGFNLTIGVGAFTITLAFFIASYMTNIWGFIVIYCLLVGAPSGVLYMLPIICGWRYFPLNRGLVSGFTIGGYGFGSFIFGFVCKAIVNPNNLATSVPNNENGTIVKYFDSRVYDKVPEMFRVVAACYLCLGIMATIMIKFPYDIDPDTMLATLEAKKKKTMSLEQIEIQVMARPECSSIKQGVKSIAFVIMVPLVLCSITFGMLMTNCYKIYGQSLGIDDSMLTTTGSVAGVFNGSSRFFWSLLMDKTSFKFTFMLISIINLATIAALPYIGNNGSGYLILVALTYLAEGGLLGTYPALSAKVFGRSFGGVMYGFFFFVIGVATVLGYVLYRFVRLSIGYSGVFWICFGLTVIGILLCLCLKENDYHWTQPTQAKQIPDQEPQEQELVIVGHQRNYGENS